MQRFLLALVLCVLPTSGWAGWIQLADTSQSIPNFGFQYGAWDPTRGVIWTARPDNSDTWKFDPATNVWSFVLANQPVPPGLLSTPGSRHNCGMAYDSLRDRVFITGCAPYPESPAPMPSWSYSVAANAWTNHGGSPGPGGDVAIVYDAARDTLISLGGWANPGYGTWERHQTDGLGATFTLYDNIQTQQPALFADLVSDPGKETFNRAGWDSTRNEMWYVARDGTLWRYNTTTRTWSGQATTGTPDRKSVV